MAESIHLKILTPSGPLVETAAEEVTAPAAEGEVGILPSHAAYLTVLNGGLLSYTSGGRRSNLAIRGGFAEVADNRVIILAEEVIRSEDVDASSLDDREREARAALDEALDAGRDEEVEKRQNDLIFISSLRAISGG